MWTDELDQQLAGMWEKGTSALKCADAIGSTRNAIIGRIDRLRKKGWILRGRLPSNKAPRHRRVRKLKPKTVFDALQQPNPPKPLIINTAPNILPDIVRPLLWRFAPRPVQVRVRNVKLIDLENDLDGKSEDCRWPMGEVVRGSADTLFCGAKTDKRIECGSYCRFHARLVYQKIDESEPKEKTFVSICSSRALTKTSGAVRVPTNVLWGRGSAAGLAPLVPVPEPSPIEPKEIVNAKRKEKRAAHTRQTESQGRKRRVAGSVA
jgi:hypothetical protein